ncbi:MAG: phosphatidyl-myo-inositol dimannoside synthase [Desulfovibrionales bacterium]|nr:phosphatidyl-myo-inositol dimannoside synthase [Desulfovibrionales bacterium]
MRIALYAPLKPLDHPEPSGDRTIGRLLEQSLKDAGHTVFTPSRLRARWMYLRPLGWPKALVEAARALDRTRRQAPDLWLTYLSYYKAPDLLGPWISDKLDLPYAIFQGSYATKYGKKAKTWPGFVMNRRALLRADLTTANKRVDFENLKRLLPEERVLYVPPGVETQLFPRDDAARARRRRELSAGETAVVMTAARFRRDVKTESLKLLIRALSRVREEFLLVLAGDGPTLPEMKKLACERLQDRAIFLDRVPRERLYEWYSAADVFAFPGLGESLGMVYLEAQCAGLPVAACASRGARETVVHEETGLLTETGDDAALAASIERLIRDKSLREAMGRAAADRVRREFDIGRNMERFQKALAALPEKRLRLRGTSGP